MFLGENWILCDIGIESNAVIVVYILAMLSFLYLLKVSLVDYQVIFRLQYNTVFHVVRHLCKWLWWQTGPRSIVFGSPYTLSCSLVP